MKKRKYLTNTVALRENYKSIVVDLFLQGYKQFEISDKLEEIKKERLDVRHITRLINEAIREWKEGLNEKIDNHKAIELEKINKLEATYWAAWEKSTSKEALKKIQKTHQTVRERKYFGDPRFLDGVEKCIKLRCNLLGITQPTIAPTLQLNQQVNNTTVEATTQVHNTTLIRNVVFKTRRTSAEQVIEEKPEN